MNRAETDYDILIAGGGMVGASLARSLAGSSLRVAVVEAVAAGEAGQPSYDERVLALSWGSRRILEGMDRWRAMHEQAQAIRHIHISDRGHFGFARMSSEQQGVPALGYVVSARAIGAALLHGLDAQSALDWICPARIEDFQVNERRVVVDIQAAGELRRVSSRLLVAADGGNSPIRRKLGVPIEQSSYEHTAVIANITPGRPHAGVAYERFTDYGPLAMLPMSEGRCSLVWTQRDDAVDQIMSLDDTAFLAGLQECFGFRLGRLQRVGRRSCYPLRLLRAKELARARVLLIGNAAHTLHPVSGQGFNLGLRDVAQLADTLFQAAAQGEDPGSMTVLNRYVHARKADLHRVAAITDTLARLFVNPWLPIRIARNLGLVALDLLPPLKNEVTRQFMGLRGRLPRLSRGLPLEL